MKIRDAYEQSLHRERHVEDAAQLNVIGHLEDLQTRILAQPPRRGGLRTMFFRSEPRDPARGLYIWGGVGRGKTFLMDLFFETLDIEQKRRIHFHRMMHDVHERMKTLSFVEIRSTKSPPASRKTCASSASTSSLSAISATR